MTFVSRLCACRKMNGTPCIATKPCLDTMTHFGCPYYSLSHQLLYFMVGKMVRWTSESLKLFKLLKAIRVFCLLWASVWCKCENGWMNILQRQTGSKPWCFKFSLNWTALKSRTWDVKRKALVFNHLSPAYTEQEGWLAYPSIATSS